MAVWTSLNTWFPRLHRLTRRIIESRLWPIEIMRVAQMGAAKGAKAGKEKVRGHNLKYTVLKMCYLTKLKLFLFYVRYPTASVLEILVPQKCCKHIDPFIILYNLSLCNLCNNLCKIQ